MIIAVLCVAVLSVTDSWQVVGVLMLSRHAEFDVLILAPRANAGVVMVTDMCTASVTKPSTAVCCSACDRGTTSTTSAECAGRLTRP